MGRPWAAGLPHARNLLKLSVSAAGPTVVDMQDSRVEPPASSGVDFDTPRVEGGSPLRVSTLMWRTAPLLYAHLLGSPPPCACATLQAGPVWERGFNQPRNKVWRVAAWRVYGHLRGPPRPRPHPRRRPVCTQHLSRASASLPHGRAGMLSPLSVPYNASPPASIGALAV